jgi:hypothetical protein
MLSKPFMSNVAGNWKSSDVLQALSRGWAVEHTFGGSVVIGALS